LVVVATALGFGPGSETVGSFVVVVVAIDVLGGGGGMSRSGPVVGLAVGVAEVSVVAALGSDVGVAVGALSEEATAAVTSTPAIDMTSSSTAHGSQGGNVRFFPGMIAVGR
jgi:hypothetical protein